MGRAHRRRPCYRAAFAAPARIGTLPMPLSAPRRAVLAACLLVLSALSAPARAEAWLTYANDRFGATVDYPDRFSVRAEPPANGDGQRFFTSDRRASLAVYGFLNALDETPRQMMDGRRASGTAYSYADANPNGFVLSGTRGGTITYLRCLRSTFSSDVFNCAELEYPAAEARGWDAVVARISRSLRSGRPW